MVGAFLLFQWILFVLKKKKAKTNLKRNVVLMLKIRNCFYFLLIRSVTWDDVYANFDSLVDLLWKKLHDHNY